jgi:VWFA-related protein
MIMDLLTRRVALPAILCCLCGWCCISLPAQQATTPNQQTTTPGQQPAGQGQQTAPADPTAPTAQPAAPGLEPQEPATPEDSKPTQNPDGTYTIQRTVRLVVLDMVVTDAKGNAVTNLARENFHVEEDGQPQNIQNFEPAGAHTLDPQLTIDSTADLDRLAPRAPVNIIVLDEFNTRFEDMAFARYSLKKFLETQPAKLPAPTILIAVNLEKFTVVHDYTQNKDELIEALEHHLVAYPWQMQQGAWVGERYATAFLTMRRVAEAVRGHPGHKNMIWIGRGFPSLDYARLTVQGQDQLKNSVRSCVMMLRNARITLYTVDPAGLMVNPEEYGGGRFADDPFGGNYQFDRMARSTGGGSLYGRNDVDAEIGTAIHDGASFYTLTYRPNNPVSPDDKKFRKIKVTVDRPDLKVTTREGYFPSSPPAPVDTQNPSRRLQVDLIAAETSTMVYDGVPISLKPSSSDPSTYTVHIDPKGLEWSVGNGTTPRQAEVILLVATFDRKGKELTQVAKEFKASAPPTVPANGRLERAIDITHKVDPDPKAARVRFVVRVSSTGRIGTADATLGGGAGTR